MFESVKTTETKTRVNCLKAACCVVALLAGGCPQPDVPPTAEKIREATYAVVVQVPVDADTTVPVTVGTAFAIRARLLATNAHVIATILDAGIPIDEVVAVQHGTGTVVELLRAIPHPDYDGKPLGSPDVGLLTAKDEVPVTLSLMPEVDMPNLGVDQNVRLAGFPGDVNQLIPITPGETVPQASLATATISSLRSFDPDVVVSADNVDFVQYQFSGFPGTSGSPVVRDGVVVAVHNAGTLAFAITGVDASGSPVLDRIPAGDTSFGVHVRHLQDLVELFDQNVLQGHALPPPFTPAASLCAASCNFCWVDTEWENNCSDDWFDADDGCDCGCQFDDPDCGAQGCQSDAECDDAVFCNGFEACVAGACQAGQPPCPAGMTCSEASRTCEAQQQGGCATDADCDDAVFCNGFEACVEGTCQAGQPPCPAGYTCNGDTRACEWGVGCTTDADCPDGQVCQAGLPGEAGTCVENIEIPDDIPLDTTVVGAWAGSGRCPDGTELTFVYFLCPQGRLRGAETIDQFDFLVCGSWSVNQDGRILLDYTATDTSVGDTWPDNQSEFEYQQGALVWVSGCPFPLQRAVGIVDEEDCTAGFCGGGEISGCGTDCDCGHCWYCENDTCRYGGEGEYGCYRGCPW